MSPLPPPCALAPTLADLSLASSHLPPCHNSIGLNTLHSPVSRLSNHFRLPKRTTPEYIVIPKSFPEEVSGDSLPFDAEGTNLAAYCMSICAKDHLNISFEQEPGNFIVCTPCDAFFTDLHRSTKDNTPLAKGGKEGDAPQRYPVRSRAKVEIYRGATSEYCQERCATGLPAREVKQASIIICPACDEAVDASELSDLATSPPSAALPTATMPPFDKPDVSLREVITTHPWCYQVISLLPAAEAADERELIETEVATLFEDYDGIISYNLTWLTHAPDREIENSVTMSERFVIEHACRMYIDSCIAQFPPPLGMSAAMCLNEGFAHNPRAKLTFQVSAGGKE